VAAISFTLLGGMQVDKVLSSANNIYLKNDEALTISLMKIKKRRGPSTEPCGTP
jgi:hypothetical protein